MHKIKSKALTATFSDYGARLLALEVDGVDVVFGTPLNEAHETWDKSAGVTCGRHAGRITGPEFTIDGVTSKLETIQDGFQLHGGPKNFGNTIWKSKASASEIEFTTVSPDGDQGFPGELHAKAIYGLTDKTLWAELTATTTKPTIINLTNHAYWNLAGQSAGKDAALSQEVTIHGNHYLPLSPKLLPTGEIAAVAGTKWDFIKPRLVKEPFDNCWLLEGKRGELKKALTQRDPASGRKMEVWTTECAVQFYTALHWTEALPGKGKPLQQHQAIAIEPQNVPDAPSHKNFPSGVLRPGTTYCNRIEWRFA